MEKAPSFSSLILSICSELLEGLSLGCCLFLDPDIDVDRLQDVISTSSNEGLVCDGKGMRRAEIK